MVIMDKNNMTSFQKAYHPTSKSTSLVITIPKAFTYLIGITPMTKLLVSVGEDKKSIVIRKIEEGDIS